MELRSSYKDHPRIFIVELLDESGQLLDCLRFPYEGTRLATPAGYEPTEKGARRYCFELWQQKWPAIVRDRRRGARPGVRPTRAA